MHDTVCYVSGNDTKEWDIRLVGGRVLWVGRVEVFLSGEWGTVSDDYYSGTQNAKVVCRQLGYNTSSGCFSVYTSIKSMKVIHMQV